MKMMNTHPRLAAGILALIIFLISLLVEVVTGIPLMSKYGKYVTVIAVIAGIVIVPIFNRKYNPEENDNAKMVIVLTVLSILLVVLVYIKWVF